MGRYNSLKDLSMKSTLLILISMFLISCSESHEGVSYELQMQLKNTSVSCEFLSNNKFSKGYWIREEMDGNGLLVVTKDNDPNMYTLALMAFGHERALETRAIVCPEL
jgi:hypothetical protein